MIPACPNSSTTEVSVNTMALTCFVELLGYDGIICPVVNVTALTCFVELLGHDGINCPVVSATDTSVS
jgi:hypothetical protein